MKYRKRMPRGESGFTLQTLIVTAVVVVLAIGVGLLLFALTSSSSEDLEDAGRRGDDAACGPNEVWDAVYWTRGIGGPNGQRGVTSKSVGCKPYCATWEFVAELSEDGEKYVQGSLALLAGKTPIGGPDGAGGVFSSNIGCFAPCYWEIGTPVQARLRYRELIGVRVISVDGIGITLRGLIESPEDINENPGSRLRYYNDNRAPDAGVIRLGVTYSRILSTSQRNFDELPGFYGTELIAQSSSDGDGKPFYYVSPMPAESVATEWGYGAGVRNAPGTPLEPYQIANGVPTVHEPNWHSPRGNVLASSEWGRFNTYGEDEDWEVRADPENEVCEIVYTPTDRLICSSDDDSCRELHISLDTCPQTLGVLPHDVPGYDFCRIP